MLEQTERLSRLLSPAGEISAEGTSVCVPCWGAACSLLVSTGQKGRGDQDQSTRSLVHFSAEPQPGAQGNLWLSSTSVAVISEGTILSFAVSFEKDRVTHSWAGAPQCSPSEASQAAEGFGMMGYWSTPSVLCPKNHAAGCRRRRHKCLQPSQFPCAL